MSALCMAIFLRGCSDAETGALTLAMAQSGTVADYASLGPDVRLVDKHSTGGVGDKISLVLAPLVASFGLKVPMMSGRGLGHTGGTLDKLEAIPGLTTQLSTERYMRQLDEVGCAIFGPTADIAPVDKAIYALRDVTGTTDSLPLIGSSIMSKKIAENPHALTLDVKTGRGAFLREWEQSLALAQVMVAAGEGAGIPTVALLTNMDQPLGAAVGNWLEAKEAHDVLQGEGPQDIAELSIAQAGMMLVQGGVAASLAEGIAMATEHLANGAAHSKFLDMIAAQGGDVSTLEDSPQAAYSSVVRATTAGVLSGIDAFEIGLTSVALGAGRQNVEDQIDAYAGFTFHKKLGDAVEIGDPIATAFAENEALLPPAVQRVGAAIDIDSSGQGVELRPLISHVMDSAGLHDYAGFAAR